MQPEVAQIPWTHHIIILNKVKKTEERWFYIKKTIENGWSKIVLGLQIENNLYHRKGKSINNFSSTLPASQSDLAKETLKNPYVFDFLSLGEAVQEKGLEKSLMDHIKKFMLELGRGFAYVGNQKNITIDGDDFFLDLLFYNYHLHCFIVFELKVGSFKPEYAGKLNFYVNTINEQLRGPGDQPTIGVLLCKTPNETVIKYSLKGIDSPIGVADYELAQSLPKQLKGEIPTVEEFEEEIEKEMESLQRPLDKKLQLISQLTKKLKTENIKEKQNKKNTLEICKNVVFQLRDKIKNDLTSIAHQFDSSEIIIWAMTRGFQEEQDLLDTLEKQGKCSEFRISLQSDGFKSAGTKSFYMDEEVIIKMDNYKYSCFIKRNPQNILWEKLYHQVPSSEELDRTVDIFGEAIAEYIIHQLEKISDSTC